MDLGNELSFSGTNANLSGNESKSWVDPFVGAQLNVALSDHWWFDLHGDVGGFDVGSKLAWQAFADVGYRASDLVSVYSGTAHSIWTTRVEAGPTSSATTC